MAASTTSPPTEIATSDNLRGDARKVWGFLSTKWKKIASKNVANLERDAGPT